MKKILTVLILIVFATSVSAEMISLPLPEKELKDAALQKCEYEKAMERLTSEAYRQQLLKLGWVCRPQGSEIICVTKDELKKKESNGKD